MSVNGMVVVDADESGLEVVRKGIVQDWGLEYSYPDLTDPATLGCLLALVREAWGWDSAFTCHDESGWCVNSGADCDVDLQDEAGDAERYVTEAAALVAALEAAEGRK